MKRSISHSHLLSQRLTIVVIYLAFCVSALAQQEPKQSEYEPPQILSPSPTVSSFMRFEDVPVNNYTGIPDISIPIFNVGTHSKDININLSLQYHPSGIAYDEEASYVGLGWSFSAGGVISRSVRDMPDDVNNGDHYGIHDAANNPYWYATSFIGSDAPADSEEAFPKFLFEIDEKERYDSEHDIYQFSFMGYSGRFIITNKCYSPSCYQVVKLDNDNAISINYDPVQKKFTLYDDRGYKYIFDIKEMTSTGGMSRSKYFDGSTADNPLPSHTYISAFHLSQIYDRQNNLLVRFTYNGDCQTCKIIESNPNTSFTYNSLLDGNPADILNSIEQACPGVDAGKVLEPREITVASTSITETKKLSQIDVVDFATIDFTTVSDRQDTDNYGGYRLKGIIVRNKKGDTIKNIELVHTYSNLKLNPLSLKDRKRMMLSKVLEHYGSKTLSYEMDYLKRKPGDQTGFYIDYWGYVTAKPFYASAGNWKNSNKFFCRMDILQKMKLPTGGSILYDWEPNTYSHIGDNVITDFSENPDNWEEKTLTYFGIDTPGNAALLTSPYDQYVTFQWSQGDGCGYSIVKKVNGQWVSANDLVYENGKAIIPGGSQYGLHFSCIVGYSRSCKVTYFKRTDIQKNFLYGGGVRIGKIGYFADNVHPLFYEGDKNFEYYQESYKPGYKAPVKEINYNYNFFADTSKSSGSLAFAKPLFDYSFSKLALIRCYIGGDGQGVNRVDYNQTYSYKTVTDFNNLKPIRTQGAEVGYKNVQVNETGNGYTRFIYRSPIDVPENSYLFNKPFLTTSNKDNQRGIVTEQMVYMENGNILSKEVNNYTVEKGELRTGLNVWVNDKCGQTADYQGIYSGYAGALNTICNGSGAMTANQIVFCANCKKPIDYIGYQIAYDAFAWNKLTAKTSFKYFYDENNTQQVVRTNDSIIYHPVNKKIQYSFTDSYNAGAIEKTRKVYTYYEGINNHIGDISRISTYNSTGTSPWGSPTIRLFGRSQLHYGNFAGIGYQKGNGPIRSDWSIISFDNVGNPEWIYKKDGQPETYIWGYNKTMPIAVVSNNSIAGVMTNASAEVNAAVAESNNINVDDAALRIKLNTLRTALPQSGVTTFTYKPLVGITSVTDPKGITTYYEYDEFNRLIAVRDSDGNLVSENAYKYKFQ